MIFFAFHQSIAIPLASATVSRLGLGGSTGERIVHFFLVYALVLAICFVADLIIRHTPLMFMAGR
ncbi:MAG: hypothetical protein VZQ80_04780 [Lachnospiraceae bacterium]|nr:hypothetical protein [Lachnospiraceae bacterium]